MNPLLILLLALLLLLYEGSNHLIIAILVRLELLGMGCACRVFFLPIHPDDKEAERRIMALYERIPEEEYPKIQQQLVDEAAERAMVRSHDTLSWYTSFFWFYHKTFADWKKMR